MELIAIIKSFITIFSVGFLVVFGVSYSLFKVKRRGKEETVILPELNEEKTHRKSLHLKSSISRGSRFTVINESIRNHSSAITKKYPDQSLKSRFERITSLN